MTYTEDEKNYRYLYMTCQLECPCGGTYQRCNLSKHKKTKQHIIWVLHFTDGAITYEEYHNQRQLLALRKYYEGECVIKKKELK